MDLLVKWRENHLKDYNGFIDHVFDAKRGLRAKLFQLRRNFCPNFHERDREGVCFASIETSFHSQCAKLFTAASLAGLFDESGDNACAMRCWVMSGRGRAGESQELMEGIVCRPDF